MLCSNVMTAWSLHSGDEIVVAIYAHLGSLARQFNGSFVVHVLGISRHFRTNLVNVRHERASVSTSSGKGVSAHCVACVRTSCFFTRIGCALPQLQSENDRRIPSGALRRVFYFEFLLDALQKLFLITVFVNRRI